MTVEWLESIRKAKRLTHQEVAVRAGISRHYYTMIANGNRRPSVEVAQRIANVLGFDWTIFFEQKSNDPLHTA
ncbi:MAG: helix-turn-helix domain-containing protein [Alicyclobacillus sp.]|nr:helix-turn-helix domain-containing protein [Alicyclobacillus sp.]